MSSYKEHKLFLEMEKLSRRRRLQEAEHHIKSMTDKYGLQEQYISRYKGRGVFATQTICKGDFVLEYRGEFFTEKEILARITRNHEAETVFLFDFKWHGQNWCMDASQEDKSLGRLVNDEQKNPNCRMKTIDVKGYPHLCLFALRDIFPGEEITYYGDSAWPWRDKASTSSVYIQLLLSRDDACQTDHLKTHNQLHLSTSWRSC
ncbi:hypothetical protein UPYG_G00257750 [Umbra pygmaea]|uniref:SET domain-containing protein n=1 Tax=Umbra pygmaea TaxID=75934 RepID=A0ABD0W8N6_UMBPY